MTDITAGETNNVPLGTDINGANLQNLFPCVLLVRTQISSIDGIQGFGGPGGPDLRGEGSGVHSGGAGVSGYGGDAGQDEFAGEILPPGTGVYGRGGSGLHYRVDGGTGVFGHGGPGGGAGVIGQGVGSFDGVAGYGDPNSSSGTGVYGQGGPGAAGVRGIGGGSQNTDPPGPAGVYGLGGPQNPGVYGQAGSGDADGVQGLGSGSGSGVAGFGDPHGDSTGVNGTGVFGRGSGPGGPGVRGIGSGGPNSNPPYAVGVYGQAGSSGPGVAGIGAGGDLSTVPSGGVGVFGTGLTGVAAQGSEAGVVGVGTSTGVVGEGGDIGVNAIGVTVGLRGQGHTGVVAAANGQPASIGLFASANAANETAGEFLGDVVILGNLLVSGLKSAVVPLPDGSHRRLYCVESPDSWFEDAGFGTLVDGHAEITLDPGFAATVHTDQYHVFLSEYDGSNALYVTARSAAGFEVRAGAGAVAASFSYRVMAKRKDIQGARLENVELPTPPQIQA